MDYIQEYHYDDYYRGKLANDIKAWIIDNDLSADIDITKQNIMEMSGMTEPYTVFSIKTESTAMAFKLRWD